MALIFKTKRRKKGLTSVQEEERYRVVTVDEKVRLLDTLHKESAGGHFGVHKTYVVLYVVNWFTTYMYILLLACKIMIGPIKDCYLIFLCSQLYSSIGIDYIAFLLI